MSETDTKAPPRRRSTQGRYRPPTWRSLVVIVSVAAALSVYLFVNAPPPLAAERPHAGTIPIRAVFAMLEHENEAARALWTQEIVARGPAVGLAFDEHWRDGDVHAGPLPALFLRETARNLERSALGIGLFLGSPSPINAANRFTGEQATHFAALVAARAPQHFVDASTGMQTAMFADVAVSEACVSCHDQHPDSPKTDWRLHDVMGAATWMYPEAQVTSDRAIALVRALRTSIRQAYAAYLAKAATFPSPPRVGATWPRDGYALPTADEFMRELDRRSSPQTLLALLDPSTAEATLAPPAPAPTTTPAPSDTLVVRTARSTRVIVEHDGSRLLVARLLPGAVTTLSSPPPLKVQVSDPDGVEVEYGAEKIPVPPRDASEPSKDVEVLVGAPNREKS